MIVTLTPNTAIDRTYFIPRWSPNRAIRASRSALGTGGKGVDASWILAEMGRTSLALGFAAGPTGRQLESLLKAKGVTPDFTWVDGETRTNIVLVCEDGSGQSTISADTLKPREADLTILIGRYRQALEVASCVVAGGTLPASLGVDFYAERAREAKDRRVPFILDAEGAPLAAELVGHPTIVKPNRHELEALIGRRLSSLQEVYEACEQVRKQNQSWVVVSLGARGGLAVLGDRVPARSNTLCAGGKHRRGRRRHPGRVGTGPRESAPLGGGAPPGVRGSGGSRGDRGHGGLSA